MVVCPLVDAGVVGVQVRQGGTQVGQGTSVTSSTTVAVSVDPVVFPAGTRAAPARTSEAPSRETATTRVRIAAVLLIASSFGRCLAPVFPFSERFRCFCHSLEQEL